MNSARNRHLISIWAALWPICLIAAGCSVILYSNKPDPPKAAPVNLNVYYGYPARNQFNSAEKFYKKETKPAYFSQTVVELTDIQKHAILMKADALHFFQMPDTFYHYSEASGSNGSKFQWIRLALDSLDKTVSWRGSIDSLQPKNFYIKELVLFVDSIVKSTDAYKALPKSGLTGD
jgi:hypothetical protein